MFCTSTVFKLASVLFFCGLCEATFSHLQDVYLVIADVLAEPNNWTVEAFVRSHGYPIETHSVTTEQGYIVTVHRIPHGRSGPSANRPVVYIQHGIAFNSASWLVLGPDDALGFVWADAGYDVWIGNVRGSTLSRKHVTINPDTDPRSFFDFSFHEPGKHDLPPIVDYILLKTGKSNLTYIGYSMGCTMFFVFLSQRPEYNVKIKAMFALAPVVYLQGPITAIGLRPFEQIQVVGDLTGVYEIFSYRQFREVFEPVLCGLSTFWDSFCTFKLQLLAEIFDPQMNSTAVEILFKSVPAGTTTKTIAHFAQLSVPSSEFKQFDYGSFLNFMKYGTFLPPLYDFSKITCPIHIYYGGADILTPETDMYRLASKFPNNLRSFNNISNYRHLNFVLADGVGTTIYFQMIQQNTP